MNYTRMGILTSDRPKCMTTISDHETIISRQLKQLANFEIDEAVITTGAFDSILINYCQSLELPIRTTFVKNSLYKETNYIYSIYCAREYLDNDVIMMHGDLVFENEVLDALLSTDKSSVTVSSVMELPEKDFKAVIHNGYVVRIGTEFFNDAVSSQPLYYLKQSD